MKIKHIASIVLLFALTACSTQKQLQKTSNIKTNLQVEAINLSENFTTLASQNDEVFIIVLQGNKDSVTVIHKTYTIFDYNKSSYETILSLKKFTNDDMLAVVLIEEDTKISLEAMTQKVSKNFATLQSAYNNKDYAATYDILADDDLLGIAIFTKKELLQKNGMLLSIKGSRLLDKYDYSIYIHQ